MNKIIKMKGVIKKVVREVISQTTLNRLGLCKKFGKKNSIPKQKTPRKGNKLERKYIIPKINKLKFKFFTNFLFWILKPFFFLF